MRVSGMFGYCIGIIIFLCFAPFAQAATLPLFVSPVVSPAPTRFATLRSGLIEAYVRDVIACTNSTSTSCRNRLAVSGDNPNARPSTCANAQGTCLTTASLSLSPAQEQVASEASAMGNDLFRHLGTLFVLDNLFRNESDGLLSPQGTSLGDLIVLYQLFFAPASQQPSPSP